MQWRGTKTASKQSVTSNQGDFEAHVKAFESDCDWLLAEISSEANMMYQWPYLSSVCTGTDSWCNKWLDLVKLTYDKKPLLSPHAGPRGRCTMATLEGWPLLPLSVRSTIKVVFLPSWFLAEIIFVIAFFQPASMAYNERYLSKLWVWFSKYSSEISKIIQYSKFYRLSK